MDLPLSCHEGVSYGTMVDIWGFEVLASRNQLNEK